MRKGMLGDSSTLHSKFLVTVETYETNGVRSLPYRGHIQIAGAICDGLRHQELIGVNECR